MSRSTQTYATHRRLFPLFHFVALPILLANVVVAVAHAIRQPSPFNAWLVILSLGLVGAILASRASALIVQNRLIALEVRLRLATTLTPDLRSRAEAASHSMRRRLPRSRCSCRCWATFRSRTPLVRRPSA